MKYYYTYVLRSLKDNNFYIGWTDNLKNRLKKHGQGHNLSTKFRRPFQLVYFEGCLSKEQALKREKSLKTGFGRKYLSNRI